MAKQKVKAELKLLCDNRLSDASLRVVVHVRKQTSAH